MRHSLALRPVLELLSLRSFQAVCAAALGARGFAFVGNVGLVASSSSGRGDDDSLEGPEIDTKYRSPTEMVWPATRHQERFAARLNNALGAVLLNNAQLRDSLVSRLGFAVTDIRMSPDNLKAFIQWDSYTGQSGALEHELRRQAPRLRAEIARALRARNVPQLVFRRDALTPRQQEVEDALRRLDEEEVADTAAQDLLEERLPEVAAAEREWLGESGRWVGDEDDALQPRPPSGLPRQR